ncbi:hypothetical protein [Sporosarcina koreensis]|uniref:hypothetical protein n=1 Tax=Sporosarcina koreensis TaxID=334735 RepID=UPI00058E332A|nr:hypothetical protein [Sporosarcina koreensis]
MLKTMKSKVIAGAVAVGVLSGGGAVLGATDAGLALKGWYDAKFTTASDKVSADSAAYASSLAPGLAAEYQGVKDNTTSKLKEKGDFVTETTIDGIDKHSQEYIDQINTQKAHIESYMSTQFGELSTFAKGMIESSGNEALAYANSDLKAHSSAEGAKVIADVNVKVKDATAEAASALQKAIDDAKTSLQNQLNTQQANTTADIKKMIDSEITKLRTSITAANNALIKEHESTITFAAKSLLVKGQNQLDSIVGSINK